MDRPPIPGRLCFSHSQVLRLRSCFWIEIQTGKKFFGRARSMVHPYHAEALLKDQRPFHPNVQEANHHWHASAHREERKYGKLHYQIHGYNDSYWSFWLLQNRRDMWEEGRERPFLHSESWPYLIKWRDTNHPMENKNWQRKYRCQQIHSQPKRLLHQPPQSSQKSPDCQTGSSQARRPFLRHSQWEAHITRFACQIHPGSDERHIPGHPQQTLEWHFTQKRRCNFCHESRH